MILQNSIFATRAPAFNGSDTEMETKMTRLIKGITKVHVDKRETGNLVGLPSEL